MSYSNTIDRISRPEVKRSSKRLTITLPHNAFRLLEQRSTAEGRSLSNLAAYLIERALDVPEPTGMRR